jgi:hypothetical protein
MAACLIGVLLFSLFSSLFGHETSQDLFNINSSSPFYFYHFPPPFAASPPLILPFHLKNHVLIESDSICQKISPLFNYTYDECLSLNYQSHRTFRQTYYESFLHKYSLPSYYFSLFLGYSYGLETCPEDLMKHILPIDVCFFGNVSPAVILITLLTCDHYRINVFDFNQNQLYQALTQFRLDFPDRSIKWIFGGYSSYFPPDSSPPNCNVIVIDEASSIGLADSDNLPIPSPVEIINLDEEDSLLLPCQGKGLIVQFHSLAEKTNGSSLLASAYKRRGISIDWRMEIISTDFSENVSILDYEGDLIEQSSYSSPSLTISLTLFLGFAYRLFDRPHSPTHTRFHFGCSSLSSQLSKTTDILSYKIHPRVSSALFQSSFLRHPTPTSLQCPDIIISYINRFFHETAFGLFQAVEQAYSELFPHSLNSLTISIWSDMNFALLLPLDRCPHEPLQIAIAPHEDTPLLKRYIVFHLEQSWSHYMTNGRYMTILKESQGIWTFTNQQTTFLASIGIDPRKIWYLPCYTDRRYLQSTSQYLTSRAHTSRESDGVGQPSKSNNLKPEEQEQEYDVLIFGSYSERRERFITEFVQNISFPIHLFRVLSAPSFSLMRLRRDSSVRKAKVSKALSLLPAPSLCLSLSPPLPLSLSPQIVCFHRLC